MITVIRFESNLGMHIKVTRYYIRYNIVDVVVIVESVVSYNAHA